MCAAIGGAGLRRGARGSELAGNGVLPVAGGARGGHLEANGSGWTHECLHRRRAGVVVHSAAKERAITPRRSEVGSDSVPRALGSVIPSMWRQ